MKISSPFSFVCFGILFVFISCKNDVKKEENITSEEKKIALQYFANPVTGISELPNIFSNGNELFLSWTEEKDSLSILYFSKFKNEKWSPSEEITSGKDWFVNWADFPAIVENNGNILTNILQKSSPDTYSYDVKLNLFNSEEKKWNSNFMLHNDGTKSEHGFVSMVPYNDSFFVTWLDGRNTGGGHEGHNHNEPAGAMTLRGAIVGVDGSITSENELDAKVCDCCQTSTALSSQGPVVVYRDRSDKEIRDISIVRWADSTWSQPKTVVADNWDIEGCPVNGPAVAAFENNLAVAWFTGKDEKPKVQITFSNDGGKSFDTPIRVDSNTTLGRVDVAMLSQESAVISWMEVVDQETFIRLKKIYANGSKGEVITISGTSSARASGFPKIAIVKDFLYIAWTQINGKQSSIQTARISLDNL